MVVWSRRGTGFADRMPRIVEADRGLPADNALIDGEAVVLRLLVHPHRRFRSYRLRISGKRTSCRRASTRSPRGRALKRLGINASKEVLPKARAASVHDRCKAVYGQRLP